MRHPSAIRKSEQTSLSDQVSDALFALTLATRLLATNFASLMSSIFGVQNSPRICRNSLHMHAGFEELESRRAFAPLHVEQFAANSGYVNDTSMPLRHETKISRRRPPVGYDKWVTAEFSVQTPAAKLWG